MSRQRLGLGACLAMALAFLSWQSTAFTSHVRTPRCLVTGAYIFEGEQMVREHALAKLARRPALYLLAATMGFY